MAKNKVIINGINTNELKERKQKEMEELFIKFRNGDKSVKDELVCSNLKLILSILKKYQNKTDNMDDLFQIGTVGLIKAIDNFDLSFGVKFSTYAVLMIEGEIKRYIRDNSQIRVSRSIKELSYKIINYREEYLSKHFEYPSNMDVCNYFNISEYELYNALNSLNDIVSIFEAVYNDSGDTIYLLDQLEDTKNRDMDTMIQLKTAILSLKDRERTILEKRYFEGLSQNEISNILGISQAQVSRIENNALNSVKKLIL